MITREEATSAGERTIRVTRVFDAPPGEVFHAWTDPEMLAQWFAPEPLTVPHVEVDLRVGGELTLTMRDQDGHDFTSTGVYREIEDPDLLVYTDSLSKMPSDWVDMVNEARGMEPGTPVEDGVATVTFERTEENKTLLTFSEEWESKATRDAFVQMQMVEGLDMTFDNLERLLVSQHIGV